MNSNNIISTPLAIIGAGPIGIELAVNLKRQGLDYLQFDANQIGHTISWWPRNTPFFSTTERVAIAGIPFQNNHQTRVTGEEYLAYLRHIIEMFDLQINTYEPVIAVEKDEAGFLLTTSQRGAQKQYRAEKIVLAIGDMHWPNKLNIPGEDLPHVAHYFNDPHDYFRKRVLIIGGKNSTAETSLRCWRAGVDVSISYRRAWFDETRVKHWLMPDLKVQIENGMIGFHGSTVPVEITPEHVVLKPTDENGVPIPDAEPIYHETDFVLFHTGHRGDQSLLTSLGIGLEGDNNQPTFNPDTMESNIAGVYLIGTVTAGVQQRYRVFIENSHEHVGKVMAHITGTELEEGLGTLPKRNYHLDFDQFKAN